jgi:hypothetical protein
MNFSKSATAAGLALVVSAGATWASTITGTYQFQNAGVACNAFSVGGVTCAAAQNDFYTPQLAFTVDPHLPTLQVYGDTFKAGGGQSPNEVNQYNVSGLGIGGANSDGEANIGELEDLELEFSHAVTITGFEVQSAGANQVGSFRAIGNPSEQFNITENSYVVGSPQGFSPTPGNATGTSFVFGIASGTGITTSAGYSLASITVEFEKKDEPEIIPVPPAAPLLGGALALLAWRARRGKPA